MLESGFYASEKAAFRAAFSCESVKIKGDKGVDFLLGESRNRNCEDRRKSVHFLQPSDVLYHMKLILKTYFN